MLSQEIREAVQEPENDAWVSWTKYLSKHYSHTIVHRVIGEYKEIARHSDIDIMYKGKFFTTHFHKTAHSMGLAWVGRDCDKSCKHRPENNPQTELF